MKNLISRFKREEQLYAAIYSIRHFYLLDDSREHRQVCKYIATVFPPRQRTFSTFLTGGYNEARNCLLIGNYCVKVN